MINNAGVWVHDPLAQLQPERLQATLAVNVVGPFLCARYAMPLLLGSKHASIVNVSMPSANTFLKKFSATGRPAVDCRNRITPTAQQSGATSAQITPSWERIAARTLTPGGGP